jgi:hypothetical protein
VGEVTDLREWSDGVWIAEAPLRFYDIPFGTFLRLGDGALLLHSPISLSPGLRSELDLLGLVKYIVSPNKLHHLFLGSAMAPTRMRSCMYPRDSPRSVPSSPPARCFTLGRSKSFDEYAWALA